ncbi:hypothetical protein CHARACLAT_006320 [Characodon lateralis]|uniref:Uncharacterized protein n=1 Tax=Characodon lateralis TaxID=208331 RepID=A0ABU7CY90_9TELE|nr:hypothetical protein [Characodon lateralis]
MNHAPALKTHTAGRTGLKPTKRKIKGILWKGRRRAGPPHLHWSRWRCQTGAELMGERQGKHCVSSGVHKKRGIQGEDGVSPQTFICHLKSCSEARRIGGREGDSCRGTVTSSFSEKHSRETRSGSS